MKTSPLLIVTGASLLPTLAMGLVGIPWSVSKIPDFGLTDITFPFSIANAPHTTGYYFAQQFNFKGQSAVGYTGLQPRPDSGGSPVIHAAFSSFIPGTTTIDSQCSDGADGGPGVSCSVEFSGPYEHTYNIEVQNTQDTTWRGTVIDTVTGDRVDIGSYTLPAGTQGIEASQVGFVEYYLGLQACSSLPYTSVVFGVPRTLMVGTGVASLGDAYEYGDCVGEAGFESQRTPLPLVGVEVSVGFA